MALRRRLCRPQTGDDDDNKAAKLFVLLDCAQCQWKVTFTWLQELTSSLSTRQRVISFGSTDYRPTARVVCRPRGLLFCPESLTSSNELFLESKAPDSDSDAN